MESVEALPLEAAAPAANGVGVAVKFGRHLQVGRLVRPSAAQDQLGAEGQTLR